MKFHSFRVRGKFLGTSSDERLCQIPTKLETRKGSNGKQDHKSHQEPSRLQKRSKKKPPAPANLIRRKISIPQQTGSRKPQRVSKLQLGKSCRTPTLSREMPTALLISSAGLFSRIYCGLLLRPGRNQLASRKLAAYWRMRSVRSWQKEAQLDIRVRGCCMFARWALTECWWCCWGCLWRWW